LLLLKHEICLLFQLLELPCLLEVGLVVFNEGNIKTIDGASELVLDVVFLIQLPSIFLPAPLDNDFCLVQLILSVAHLLLRDERDVAPLLKDSSVAVHHCQHLIYLLLEDLVLVKVALEQVLISFLLL